MPTETYQQRHDRTSAPARDIASDLQFLHCADRRVSCRDEQLIAATESQAEWDRIHGAQYDAEEQAQWVTNFPLEAPALRSLTEADTESLERR